ncbi:MAG: hemoblobin-interacting domain-containing protein [Thermacetogeniaceae bacterium]|jgi:uncharacterized repeat protein (TIGR02059 family)
MWINRSRRPKTAVLTALLCMFFMFGIMLPAEAADGPRLLAAEVTTQGDISLTFDRKIVVPEGAKSQFIVTVDGEEVAVNKVETTNTVGKIKLELDTKLNEVAWKTLTVEYIQSDNPNLRLKDSTDNYVANFSIKVPYSALSEAPTLIADTDNNTLGQAVDITFADDPNWREAIKNIKVNDQNLSDGQYTISEGKINIAASVFTEAGEYTIVVKADGYQDAKVKQVIKGSEETEQQEGVKVIAEITTDGSVSLNFIKKDGAGELTIIVPEGKSKDPQFTSQFTVMVDGKEVDVVQVSKVKKAGKIKLTLASPIQEGQEVKVAYSRADDESLWLRFDNEEAVGSFDFIAAVPKEQNGPETEQPITQDPENADEGAKADNDSDTKLPKTGGLPLGLLWGLGILIAATGGFLVVKNK